MCGATVFPIYGAAHPNRQITSPSLHTITTSRGLSLALVVHDVTLLAARTLRVLGAGALEVLLAVLEAELVALEPEDLAELRRPAEEDRDLALLLLLDLLEHLVPVRPARVRPRLQPRDQVALRLKRLKMESWL